MTHSSYFYGLNFKPFPLNRELFHYCSENIKKKKKTFHQIRFYSKIIDCLGNESVVCDKTIAIAAQLLILLVHCHNNIVLQFRRIIWKLRIWPRVGNYYDDKTMTPLITKKIEGQRRPPRRS